MIFSKKPSPVDPTRALVEPLLKEPVDRYVLPNGLTVLLKPDPSSPVCSVQVWIKSGSVHEGRLLGAGLSHFLEHMLFKGGARREGKEISRVVHEAGGYINAYTTFDRTVYYIDVPVEHAEVALDALSDAVFASTLPADEVEKEREVIMREIAMCDDDPDTRLSHALFETAFRHHPYRYPIIGYADVFRRVTRDELLAYYHDRYAPNNAVVVVAGGFAPAAMREQVARWFGGFQRRAFAPAIFPDEPRQLAPRSLDLFEDVNISRVAIGFRAPGIAHEDAPALDALAMVLGHGDSSLLYQRLREETQLVHSIDVHNWTPGSLGVFYISILCDPDKREAANAELRRYLSSLTADDFTPEIVEKMVRQMLVNEVNARKTVSGQASRLGIAEVVIGDIGYAERYLRRVGEITAEDLHRVLNKWVRWESSTVVTLNPRDDALAAASPAGAARATADFLVETLPNGSKLLLRQNGRLPNLHFRIAMQAGALFEPSGKQGLTALLATMMTKDTAKRSAYDVAFAIEAVGGNFYECSGNNSMGFALETLPSDADLALDVLEEALLRPAFDEEVFEIEKEARLAGIKEDLDDIVAAGKKALRRRFYGSHPFAIDADGSLETVASIQLRDLKDLWKSLLLSGNVTLAVSGQFDRAELEPKLRALLGKLPAGVLPSSGFVSAEPARAGNWLEAMDRQQAIVYHAYPSPGLLAPDYAISEVADELFSGMSSVLFERVREELSLAYFVRSNRVVGLRDAMFYFYAGTAPARAGEVVAELDREVRRVATGGVSADEIQRCKNRLKAARRMSLQTNSACANHAAMNVVYGLPANDERDYESKIDAVSAEDLQNFARRYLASGNRIELIVGPTA